MRVWGSPKTSAASTKQLRGGLELDMDFEPNDRSVGRWHLCSSDHPIRVEIGRLDDISDRNSIQPLVSRRKEIHFPCPLVTDC